MKIVLAILIWIIIGLGLFLCGRTIYRFIKSRIEKRKNKEVNNDIEDQEKGE